MAINKTINKSTKTHAAMRNCIGYVLKEQKITDGLVYVTGPYSPDVIDRDHVYLSFMEEKQIWNKDSGRMYNHNIISFHKDENITPEEAFSFGKEFAEKWFPDHQTLISVHQDKDHLHIHLVTNTVSFMDGRKLHNTKTDLERMKQFTNHMCETRNLSIAEKGKHFDGTAIEEGSIIAWSKDKYHLAVNESKDSYLADCALAVMDATQNCCDKETFIQRMAQKGWQTNWSDTRKHITFQNGTGRKVRDSNLSKTFSININKEALYGEFKRQNEIRLSDLHSQQLDRYYDEIEAAIAGTGTDPETVGNNTTTTERNSESHTACSGQRNQSTDALIRELNANERAAKEKRDNSLTQRKDRDLERERSRAEAQRLARERERQIEAESVKRRKRSRSHDFSL